MSYTNFIYSQKFNQRFLLIFRHKYELIFIWMHIHLFTNQYINI